MKLAVVDNLPVGGAKRVVYEQLKRLSLKYEVNYYTNKLEGGFNWPALKVNIRRRPLTIPEYRGLRRPLRELALLTRLKAEYGQIAQEIREFGASAVIAHPCRYTQAPQIIDQLKQPVIYFAHEWYRELYEPDVYPVTHLTFTDREYEVLRRQMIAKIDRHQARAAKRVVTTSLYNAGHIKQVYQIPEVTVAPLGVDSQLFKPDNINHKREYFLYIGEPDESHGHDLVTLIKQLAPKELQIRELAFKNRQFKLSDRELVTWYQRAVATLCFDRHEPFGLVPIESMACGTPVIAVNEGGYRESVDDGRTGFLVPRQPEVIYGLMKKLATEAITREAMSRACRETVVQNYRWESHLKILDNIINEVTG